MLEHVKKTCRQLEVFRLASHQTDSSYLRKLDLDATNHIEQGDVLFPPASDRDVDKALLDTPFLQSRLWQRRQPSSFRKSRFSDGTFPVFYASLEAQTAEAEAMHWFYHRLPHPPTRYQRYRYMHFRCDFSGSTVDLRSMQAEWPGLTALTDYDFCNDLGSEAVRSNIDGFLTPSVRKEGGTNVPVFARRALSGARHVKTVYLTFDPKAGVPSVSQSVS